MANGCVFVCVLVHGGDLLYRATCCSYGLLLPVDGRSKAVIMSGVGWVMLLTCSCCLIHTMQGSGSGADNGAGFDVSKVIFRVHSSPFVPPLPLTRASHADVVTTSIAIAMLYVHALCRLNQPRCMVSSVWSALWVGWCAP